MTVKELIEELKNFDENMEITIVTEFDDTPALYIYEYDGEVIING